MDPPIDLSWDSNTKRRARLLKRRGKEGLWATLWVPASSHWISASCSEAWGPWLNFNSAYKGATKPGTTAIAIDLYDCCPSWLPYCLSTYPVDMLNKNNIIKENKCSPQWGCPCLYFPSSEVKQEQKNDVQYVLGSAPRKHLPLEILDCVLLPSTVSSIWHLASPCPEHSLPHWAFRELQLNPHWEAPSPPQDPCNSWPALLLCSLFLTKGWPSTGTVITSLEPGGK